MEKIKSKIAISCIVVTFTAGMSVEANSEGLEWFDGYVKQDIGWVQGSSRELNMKGNDKNNSLMWEVTQRSEEFNTLQGVRSSIRWW
jgi:hypothetical protein